MSDVKKYLLTDGVCNTHCLNGVFIQYSDHLAVIAEKDREIGELEAQTQTDRPVVSREAIEAQIALELSGCDLIITVSAPFIGERIVTQEIGADSGKILARHLVNKIPALQLPAPQPVAGQVGEAITSIEQVDLSDMAREVTEKEFDFFASKEALRQPVETVGEEDQGEPIHQVGWLDPKDPTRIHVTTHYMIRELGNPENWLPIYAPNNTEALRTQPQATVVEVPTVEEIENAYDGGWDSVPTLDDLGIKESDDDFCSYFNDHQKLAHGSGVRAIHALIQRTIGGGK